MSMQSNSFQNALEKAKAVAAKIGQNIGSKRPAEDDGPPLQEVKRQAAPPPPEPMGERVFDMQIPGTKIGYVIGKGGEMIRTLQDRAGVKMTVIQNSAEITTEMKLLRIIGDQSKVDFARQLVNDLLAEKEMESQKMRTRDGGSGNNGGGPPPTNEYGSSSSRGGNAPGPVEILVPAAFIGLVIGRSGENIKRIQAETQTKVQFDTTKSDPDGNRMCTVSGNHPDAVQRAAGMVREIIDNAANGHRGGPGGVGGGPMKRGGGHHGSGPPRGGGNHSGGGGGHYEEIKMSVPVHRTGIVIGKGGESIKAIKQQSGCDIELDKSTKGVFIIRGTTDRIAVAQRLINEKAHGRNGPQGGHGQDHHNASGSYGDYQANHWQQNSYWAQEQSQSSSSAAPGVAAPDASNQDQNAAAWAAYYAQYYNNPMARQMSGMGQSSAGVPGASSSSNGQDPQDAASAAAGGGQDYSQQWIEYYRAYGMHKEADAIEALAKNMKQNL